MRGIRSSLAVSESTAPAWARRSNKTATCSIAIGDLAFYAIEQHEASQARRSPRLAQNSSARSRFARVLLGHSIEAH
eukprot:scaffold29524_cov34-Tisochrysis_lutea.AAC.3